MSSEKVMRKQVIKALRPLDAVSVENGCGIGTPDVNFADGWIELKSLKEWPRRAASALRIPCFTLFQVLWLARRQRAGGRCYLLVKVGRDWLLFRPDAAAVIHRGATPAEWLGCAAWKSLGRLDDAGLLHWMREDAGRRVERVGAGVPGEAPETSSGI